MKDIFATHELSPDCEDLSILLRKSACMFDGYLDSIVDGREKALARTKLEECLMWANKAIAIGGLKK